MFGSSHLKATPATMGLLLAACATPQADRLDAFETTLLSHDSATAALTRWCAARNMAVPPVIKAVPVKDAFVAPPPELGALLDLLPGERLGYRHVRLTCGDETLSIAQNWFVPDRLPDQMNDVLGSTHTPFGKVIGPLGFTRERLDAVRGRGPGCPEGTVLSHSGLLRLNDGRPISLVMECYTEANLRFQ
ncbi:MAG: hypothetical protein KDE55_24255 [Novosphingobium sp.]|nr:hypothetical protein [Novosphingobium sp.]